MKLATPFALAAMISAALIAAPAAAAESDTPTELRCILLSGNMVASSDAQARQAGMSMAFYYLGRLDRKFSAADLQAKLIEEAKVSTAAKLTTAATTCGEQFQARGRFLEDLGKKLSAEAAKAAPPQKAGPKE